MQFLKQDHLYLQKKTRDLMFFKTKCIKNFKHQEQRMNTPHVSTLFEIILFIQKKVSHL